MGHMGHKQGVHRVTAHGTRSGVPGRHLLIRSIGVAARNDERPDAQ